MRNSKRIGVGMIVTLFLAVFGFGAWLIGIREMLIVFGGVAIFAAYTGTAAWLIRKDNN